MKRSLWVYFLAAFCYLGGFLVGMTYGPMPLQPKAWIVIMMILTVVFGIATGIAVIYKEIKDLE